jgi:phage terminase large subunit
VLAIRPALRPLVIPTTRFSVGVCHRRAGKTVAAVQRSLLKALSCQLPNARTAYVAPTYGQAKRAAWDYLKLISRPVASDQHETELRVTLVNGARVQLFGADNADTLRGMYFDDIVLDEYADMAPSVWPLVIRPALSDRRGSALFIGTPKGRNSFYEIWEQAGSAPHWSRTKLKASESGLIDLDELEAARLELTSEQFEQEFECSFDAAVLGAYYGKEIAEAERAGRIATVEVDPAIPVHTAWDLGIGDSTAIWFFQIAPNGVRIVDYYENHSQGLPHYVSVLSSRGYRYGDDFVPHDAKARELGSGRTRAEILMSLGRKPRLVPMHTVEDGINAGRVSFGSFWFDAGRCKDGIEALRQYRADFDEKKRVFTDRPRHDWTSHAADAFRYMAMAWRTLQPERPVQKPTHQVFEGQPDGTIRTNMSVRDIIEAKKRERAKRLYG